jgi:hypothetical protein
MEDFFAGIIGEIFTNLLCIPIGFVYLWLRYRKQAQVKAALVRKYEDSYANAGSEVVTNIIAAVLILLIFGLIVVAPLLHWLRS